jgi:4-alpha-glucanotransferase
MRIGLYQDLAVGTAGWGSETWLYPGLFAEAASIGCPPDPLGPEGQDWGLPPVNPRRLLATDLAYWRKLLRAAMAHAGALRIDHAMGLVRQFWIPCGRPASEGAYVVYPAERMLGVLAEESRRAGALVVGEDLGTVPEGFAATLERWGILSTRVLPFERDASGTFLAAAAHSSRALLVASTHDLPPLWGWWRGADLEVRRSLGLLGSDEDLAAAQQRRLSDRARLVRRLHAEGLVPTSWEPTSAAELAHAVHAFLCSTPAPLVGLTLEDLCGETAPLNVPGVTQDRYPSWTLRLSVDVEDLPAHAGVRRALAGAAARRRASS